MQVEEPSLEEGEKHDDHGHHQEYQPGEFHIDAQHYNRSAQHIKRKIRSVEELPGEELTYPRGIAHDPCVDVAHAVLIVVIEGQFLQVGEGLIPHIPVHADLGGKTSLDSEVADYSRQYYEKHVYKRERNYAVKR